MKFALNYSPQAAALLREGTIALDLFKCPDWDDVIEQAAALCPVYVHFPLRVGLGHFDGVDWDKIERLLKTTETAFVNAHFAPRHPDFETPPPTEAVLAHLCADVGALVERFGAARVIVENVPYIGKDDPDDFLPQTAEAALFHTVLGETGAGFLLDISHARHTALFLGIDQHTYIESLPLHRLRELHVTGLKPVDGVLTDHMDLPEEGWAYVEWAVEQIRRGVWATPHLLAFEYGGVSPMFDWRSRSDVIAEQVPRLLALAHSVG